MRKSLALIVALVVTLAPLLVSPPAGSAGYPWKATITFDKDSQHQFASRVVWRLFSQEAGAWKLVETRSWRGGSGLPGRGGQNSCAWSRGWLPNGTYGLRLYDNYPGHTIHGRAFRLDNKNCGNGNVRHDLFLHTEQATGNRQCRDRRGDQSCRWEWPRINDYKSLGCVKMAPGDLAELTVLFKRHFAAGTRYPTDRVAFVVTS